MRLYAATVFALMAFYFLSIGVKVVISKRPLFMSSRYFFFYAINIFTSVCTRSVFTV